ncbi:hypothetical protein LCGC14_0221250 [marine sediment metagenome]|uniref:HNH nuclease domain-containing protein n=1 Tax=marine sediment metagenome TaxID=412755 RepID=A0A0F9UUS2_9ZZZZ
MPKLIDLTGKRFGRLVVICRDKKNRFGTLCWLCLCDCGKEKIILCGSLKSGKTKSCGCLRKEIISKIMTKHGHTKNRKQSQVYRSWYHIIQRCTNSNTKDYRWYGSRGITVCERWLKFENFLEDMGEAPIGYQIDRLDNNKGYYLENCRWVTPKQNGRNKRNNHLITHNGEIQCISAWAEETGISKNTILWRITHGWSPEKTLTTPGKMEKTSDCN